ncbi:SDR family NAD(P)-dependent oxidoreductase [Planctomycetota bacterium]|nr:SDR family NAD(P)-dependent oxidoreductase [Planctomycetota bacterium]
MPYNVMITGAGSGFGKLAALSLVARGHHVFATMRDVEGRNKEASASLVSEAMEWVDGSAKTGDLSVIELDVADQKSVDRAIELILSETERIDVLVNNAGLIGEAGPLEVTGIEPMRKMLDVIVLGAMRVTNSVLPTMRKQRSGLIVQISSTTSTHYVPFSTTYTGAKAACEHIAAGYRYELAPLGIDSVVVQPGGYETAIMHKVLKTEHPELLNEYEDVLPLMKKLEDAYGGISYNKSPSGAQDVADAIVGLIEMEAGERPFVTVVDETMRHVVDPINELSDVMQRGLFEELGVWDDMQLVK